MTPAVATAATTTVAVLGAAGTIGPAIVRDLAESREVERLLLLDLAADRAEAVAGEHGAGRATAAAIDATDAGTSAVPRAVLLACATRRQAVVPPSNRTTAVTVPHDRWGLGGGVVSTAAPAAEAARRLVRGDVTGVGVLAPERAFEAAPFLAALGATGCTISCDVTDAAEAGAAADQAAEVTP
ncbi:MAG: hypothetical protein ACRDZN_08630 [Acidimicrobiales bacterium]